MKPQTLADIMALGVHKPVASQGATLALALHCLMIREGFSVVDSSPDAGPRRSSYAPPHGWRLQSATEWEFTYTRDGKANNFTLVVSLHPESGRVFVHASEVGSEVNIQVLGLQLESYVPDATQCSKAVKWDGIMANEDILAQHFLTHISHPLIDLAEDLSPRMLYKNNNNKFSEVTETKSVLMTRLPQQALWLSKLCGERPDNSSLSPYLWAGVVAAAGASMALYATRHSWAH